MNSTLSRILAHNLRDLPRPVFLELCLSILLLLPVGLFFQAAWLVAFEPSVDESAIVSMFPHMTAGLESRARSTLLLYIWFVMSIWSNLWLWSVAGVATALVEISICRTLISLQSWLRWNPSFLKEGRVLPFWHSPTWMARVERDLCEGTWINLFCRKSGLAPLTVFRSRTIPRQKTGSTATNKRRSRP